MTASFCSVDPPRGEYPRPQLRRDRWWNLNGTWAMSFDDGDAGRTSGWHRLSAADIDVRSTPLSRQIVVPFAPQAPLSGVVDPRLHDVIWYARTFASPEYGFGESVLLHFGAVDYRADVWVNGIHVVSHEGGHTPFQADVTDTLDPQGNALVVRAEDFGAAAGIPRGKQDWQENPSHIFYQRTTGIWQTVWLEVVDRVAVTGLYLVPDVAAATVGITASVATWEPGCTLHVTFTCDGQPAGEGSAQLQRTETELLVCLEADAVRLWSPGSPTLYDVRLEVRDINGAVRDRVYSYVGMRNVEVRDGRLLLNGEPIFLRLVLDQGYWPDGLMTAPNDDALRRDIELAQALGFNGARKHQKVEDPRWLYWADRLGFLVWGEMANAYDFCRRYVRRITAEWQEVLDRDVNHPCVIAWVPINESSGCRSLGSDGRTPVGAFQSAHASAMYYLTKSLDPTRAVISNDGWEHTLSDLCTVHDYGDADALAKRFPSIEQMLQHARDTQLQMFAVGHEYSGQPVVVSEFGGIFLGKPPEHFTYQFVESAEELPEAVGRLAAVLTRSPFITGYCYTQLTDVDHERNGLLTADRVPKTDLQRLRSALHAPHGKNEVPASTIT
jgi:beta-galactosidase/beta-glucuronidase